MRLTVKLVAVFCLALTLCSAYAVLAHHHASNIDSAKCAVCIAAHTAAPKALAQVVEAQFTCVYSLAAESVSGPQRALPFALNVRPPPAA